VSIEKNRHSAKGVKTVREKMCILTINRLLALKFVVFKKNNELA